MQAPRPGTQRPRPQALPVKQLSQESERQGRVAVQEQEMEVEAFGEKEPLIWGKLHATPRLTEQLTNPPQGTER